jgi:GNAT superfamily N-acetyltransferase
MIRLVPINPEGTRALCDELGRRKEMRKTFPMMGRGTFHQSVLAGHQIQDGKNVTGFLLVTNPTLPFRIYGERESLLMIYPEHQRQGIGTQVMSLICEDSETTFFVSSISNPVSTAFFQKQTSLSLSDETDRYRVYTL